MITSHLKENIIQGVLLYVIRSLHRVGFRFQYQLINLIWLSLDFFHLAEASLSAFLCFYAVVCAVIQKSRNVFYL